MACAVRSEIDVKHIGIKFSRDEANGDIVVDVSYSEHSSNGAGKSSGRE